MRLGNRSSIPNEAPLVIAEICINHGGNLGVTKNIVDLVASSGGEYVKHQTHSIKDKMTEKAKSIFPPNTKKSKLTEK